MMIVLSSYAINNAVKKIFLIVVLFLSLNVHADLPKNNIADLQIPAMIEEVKRNITYFSIPSENCAGCASSVIPILDCQEIMNHRFLIIARESTSLGGEEVYIAIDSDPLRYFKLWIYPIDKSDEYQMRLLKEVSLMAEEVFFADLREKYPDFWRGFE